MPTYIMKLRDHYCEWSTICDAPTSQLRPLPEFCQEYAERYGVQGIISLGERLVRVERNGTSARDMALSAADLLAGNRAGDGEKTLTEEELFNAYKSLAQKPPSPMKDSP